MEMSLADFKILFRECYTAHFVTTESCIVVHFSAVCEMNRSVEVILFAVCL
jgi:hypothetical protein